MPELPEVETFKGIAARCVGRTIGRVRIIDPDMLEGVSSTALQRRLKNARIAAVCRHGKHLFLDLGPAGVLALHFGMNGSLRLASAAEPDPRFVRLSLDFAEGDKLAYVNPRRIGTVRLAKDVASFLAEKKLGPDALDRHFDLAGFARLVAGSKRDIKAVLMDQELVAGIGNIYSDEILFQARIHPGAKAAALGTSEIKTLFGKVKDVLETAVERKAGSETGVERLPKNFLLRERGPGGHCPRCGGALAAEKHGGRTTYYCPRCQKRR